MRTQEFEVILVQPEVLPLCMPKKGSEHSSC